VPKDGFPEELRLEGGEKATTPELEGNVVAEKAA
jgi:hypothetical protein